MDRQVLLVAAATAHLLPHGWYEARNIVAMGVSSYIYMDRTTISIYIYREANIDRNCANVCWVSVASISLLQRSK